MTLEPQVPSRPEWRLAGIIFFGLVALTVLWAAAMIIRPFLTAILLAAVMVTITFPLFRRLRLKMKGHSGLAAVVMVIGLAVMVLLPAVFLGLTLVQQAQSVLENFQSGEVQAVLQRVDLSARLGWVRRFVPSFDPASVSPQRLLSPVFSNIPGFVAKHGASLVGGIAGALVSFVFVLLAAWFFYVEGESILQELSNLSPLPAQYDHEFAVKFKDVIDATFRGHLITALVQGLVTAAGLAIAGVPAALFWGAVAVITSLLPMVGAAAVWVPATIYLFILASMGTRGYFGVIFLAAWGVLVVSLVDNVVRPWAMRGNAQLPAIPLLFSVLGGLQAFGFIGLVAGPLVFSLLMSVIDIYKRSFSLSRLQPTTGEAAPRHPPAG